MAAGEHPKVVQELLGRASVTLTLDTYSHVMQGQPARPTAKLSALLTPTGDAAGLTGGGEGR